MQVYTMEGACQAWESEGIVAGLIRLY